MKLNSLMIRSLLATTLSGTSVCLVLNAYVPIASAQFNLADPTENLSKALQLPNDKEGNRDKAVAEASSKMQQPAEIWRAACLADWREFHPDGSIATSDREIKTKLVTKFQEKLGKILAETPADEADSILDLVLNIAREERLGMYSRPFSKAAAAVLCQEALKGNSDNRVARIRAYGMLNPETNQGIGFFTSLLSENEMRIRRAALDGISYWVEACGPSEETKDQGNNTRRRNQAILCMKTVPLVHSSLKDKEVEVRKRASNHIRIASYVLNSMIADPQGKTVLNVNDPGQNAFAVDRKAALELATILEQVRPSILMILRDENLETRISAHMVIEELALSRKAWKSQTAAHDLKDTVAFPIAMNNVLEELSKSVLDTNFRVRRTALETFELLGAEAASSTAVIVKALDDPDRFVRWTAVRALVEIGSSTKAMALPKLTELLQDQDGDVRKAAALAISKLAEK